MIDKQRWQDELNPEQVRAGLTVTLCWLAVAVLIAYEVWR